MLCTPPAFMPLRLDRFLSLAIVVLCTIVCDASVADETDRLRVVSYNIHHGVGVDGRVDLERIARVILSVDADLVALQEVDCNTKRTNLVDQPARLASLTKMQVVFGDNIPYQGGRYGNAVLSRLPIVRHENHALPSFYEGEQRGVLCWRCLNSTDRQGVREYRSAGPSSTTDVCATNEPLLLRLLAKFGLPLGALGSLVAQRSIELKNRCSLVGFQSRAVQAFKLSYGNRFCSHHFPPSSGIPYC